MNSLTKAQMYEKARAFLKTNLNQPEAWITDSGDIFSTKDTLLSFTRGSGINTVSSYMGVSGEEVLADVVLKEPKVTLSNSEMLEKAKPYIKEGAHPELFVSEDGVVFSENDYMRSHLIRKNLTKGIKVVKGKIVEEIDKAKSNLIFDQENQ